MGCEGQAGGWGVRAGCEGGAGGWGVRAGQEGGAEYVRWL